MFRKILLLALPVLVVLSTSLVAFALERQRTPDWQLALDAYLARTSTDADSLVVDTSALGTQPWHFDAVAGNPQLTGAWPWGTERLPYPPDALRCVVVQPGAANIVGGSGVGREPQVLFVAHHTDKLWRVGWVVHAGPTLPLVEAARATLDAVGCRPETLGQRR